MKTAYAFMLVAMVPAAANPSLAAKADGFVVPLCSAGGEDGSTVLISGKPTIPGSEATLCCAKGCQGSKERKKAKRRQN